ncbi:hypothetical protein CYMTET_50865 [Cymbomonas tetramitiformis]|uniref:Exocyst subunit Exo70 family protein n=1 Tax=Cymbomonas tetramitiformis TaxID=36881 RepID=A0AAE0BMC5_9CHLO|nr:hypothetical protein CYMTET_50865 [Cymbomonas tetramitiformis]
MCLWDAGRYVVDDGTVHPLTSYVLNYIKRLFDFLNALPTLFGEEADELAARSSSAPLPSSGLLARATAIGKGFLQDPDVEGKSEAEKRMTVAVTRIFMVLQTNLETKASCYKRKALAQVFMMNNMHYIVKSVRKTPEMLTLLGEEWADRQDDIVEQYCESYRLSSWADAMEYVSAVELDGTAMREKDRAMIKEKFRNFNTRLEELHHEQAQWAVPDPDLRVALRNSIIQLILPSYGMFVEEFPASTFTKYPDKYIKYSPKRVEAMVQDLFENKVKNWYQQEAAYDSTRLSILPRHHKMGFGGK